MFGPVEIPNKSSFKINEVCALTGIKSYVLRFWESEFPEIAPMVSSSGVKLYEHQDVEAILTLKKLLFEDKMTIDQAKIEMKNLMGQISLGESHSAEAELFDEEFISNRETPKSRPSIDTALAKREFLTERVLIESDFQKLILAKDKLNKILDITKTLHQKNDWGEI